MLCRTPAFVSRHGSRHARSQAYIKRREPWSPWRSLQSGICLQTSSGRCFYDFLFDLSPLTSERLPERHFSAGRTDILTSHCQDICFAGRTAHYRRCFMLLGSQKARCAASPIFQWTLVHLIRFVSQQGSRGEENTGNYQAPRPNTSEQSKRPGALGPWSVSIRVRRSAAGSRSHRTSGSPAPHRAGRSSTRPVSGHGLYARHDRWVRSRP